MLIEYKVITILFSVGDNTFKQRVICIIKPYPILYSDAVSCMSAVSVILRLPFLCFFRVALCLVARSSL